jgi:hypothetical protein
MFFLGLIDIAFNIPEPSTIALALMGLSGIAAMRAFRQWK